jgi:hypothetical protein
VNEKIHIPNPCSENPEYFSATSNGGFCQKCHREVIDFREMNDKDILDFLSRNPSKRCGIFSPNQLPVLESPVRKMKFLGIWALGFLGITGFSFPVIAQTSVPPSVEQKPFVDAVISKTDTTQLVKRTIKGKVISFYFSEKQSAPGALVQLKGYESKTTTNPEGYFELEVPDSVTSQKIIVSLSFIGYKTKEVTIYDTQLPVQLGEIELREEDISLMGEFIYIKPNLWQKIKGVFKSKKSKTYSNLNHSHL